MQAEDDGKSECHAVTAWIKVLYLAAKAGQLPSGALLRLSCIKPLKQKAIRVLWLLVTQNMRLALFLAGIPLIETWLKEKLGLYRYVS